MSGHQLTRQPGPGCFPGCTDVPSSPIGQTVDQPNLSQASPVYGRMNNPVYPYVGRYNITVMPRTHQEGKHESYLSPHYPTLHLAKKTQFGQFCRRRRLCRLMVVAKASFCQSVSRSSGFRARNAPACAIAQHCFFAQPILNLEDIQTAEPSQCKPASTLQRGNSQTRHVSNSITNS